MTLIERITEGFDTITEAEGVETGVGRTAAGVAEGFEVAEGAVVGVGRTAA